MLELSCKIEINGNFNVTITKVIDIEISRSISNPIGRCLITLPKTPKLKKIINPTGTKIKVYLGYNKKYKLRFDGIIRSIETNINTKIICHDHVISIQNCMLHIEHTEITDMKELINKSITNHSFKIEQKFCLGKIYPARLQFYYLYDHYLSKYKIRVYQTIRNDKYFICIGDEITDIKTFNFDINKNIIKYNLKHEAERSFYYYLHLTSINKYNERISLKGGIDRIPAEHIKINYYNLSKKELENEFERLENYLLTTLHYGSLTLFGEPSLELNDIIKIKTEEKIIETKIDSLKIKFGKNGYRQEISVGKKEARLR